MSQFSVRARTKSLRNPVESRQARRPALTNSSIVTCASMRFYVVRRSNRSILRKEIEEVRARRRLEPLIDRVNHPARSCGLFDQRHLVSSAPIKIEQP